MNTTDISSRLQELADADHAHFLASHIPHLDASTIIGARNPAMRKLARSLWKEDREAVERFLEDLPHDLFEENMLHAFFLDHVRDIKESFDLVERFLPFVDNWAVCDALNPGGFSTDLARVEQRATEWIASEHTYTRRFGVCMHIQHFLNDAFQPEFLTLVGGISSQEYYIHMVQGWYFATALALQPEATLPWLLEDRLSAPVRRKAIQKSIESFRVDEGTKDLLRAARAQIPRSPRKGVG